MHRRLACRLAVSMKKIKTPDPIGLGQPRQKAPRNQSKSGKNWAKSRAHAQARLAAAKAHRAQMNHIAPK